MTCSRFLLLSFLFLSGCETLNEAVVRHMFRDSGVSRRIRNQIREGLEKREGQPPDGPHQPAPAFLDQG